ncbi:MAG: four helix bundle protein [Ignavibacteriales bacterium]|nr:four helix bundle protein [Ignavibacteriales bacterium]
MRREFLFTGYKLETGLPTFTDLEEIDVWQKARSLVSEVYRVSQQGKFGRDFPLRDQIRRAVVSVMANIAKGHGRGGTREFIQFLSIAKGSVSEVISHLYVGLDQGYLSLEIFTPVYNHAAEVGKMIGGLMNYLKSAGYRGIKFK